MKENNSIAARQGKRIVTTKKIREYAPNMNVFKVSDASDSDSDIDFKYIFPFRHDRSFRDRLRFILTIWYCPETSSSIADIMANVYSDTKLRELVLSPTNVVFLKSQPYFLELNI